MTLLFDGPSPLDQMTLGTVLHVGAGGIEVLEAYGELSWRHLVLVEGDPDTSAELQAAVGNRGNVRVIAQAVAPCPGPMDWHRYNLPRLNGPVEAFDLVSVYPRLRQIEHRVLDGTGFDALLQAVPDDTLLPNLLVLDLPGQEAGLLAAVSGDLLRRFDWIALRTRAVQGGSDSGDDSATASMAANLASEGFVRVELASAPDPLWPLTLLHFDRATHDQALLRDEMARSRAECDELARQLELERRENATLRDQIETASREAEDRAAHDQALLRDEMARSRAECDELARQLELERRENATLRDQIETASREAEELRAAASRREAELKSRVQDLSTALAETQAASQQFEQRALALAAAHQAGLESRASELAAARTHLESVVEEHARAVSELRQEMAQQVQSAADAKNAHEARTRELEAALRAEQQRLASERNGHEAAIAELRQQVQAMTESAQRAQDRLDQQLKERQAAETRAAECVRALEDEVLSSRQAAALSLKLQTLREADLSDLQARYRATLAQQQSQHELLTKLAQRLTLANRYFHELSQSQQAGLLESPGAPRKRRTRNKTGSTSA